MSRLLFAAARGARVQFFAEQSHRYEWMHIERVPLKEPQAKFYRIHPDDAHLQYGPVSTALRDRVIHDDPWHDEFQWAISYMNARWPNWHYKIDGHDYLASLLILAEALADEGL